MNSKNGFDVIWDLRTEGGERQVFCVACDKTFFSWPYNNTFQGEMYPEFDKARTRHFETQEHRYNWELAQLAG